MGGARVHCATVRVLDRQCTSQLPLSMLWLLSQLGLMYQLHKTQSTLQFQLYKGQPCCQFCTSCHHGVEALARHSHDVDAPSCCSCCCCHCPFAAVNCHIATSCATIRPGATPGLNPASIQYSVAQPSSAPTLGEPLAISVARKGGVPLFDTTGHRYAALDCACALGRSCGGGP